MHEFNNCKSTENHQNLNQRKSRYKKLINKKKRDYERYEGNMLNKMRKENPKLFYKNFSKKKKNCTSDISMDKFFDYFKNLISSDENLHNTEATEHGEAVYEELDLPISEHEIEIAIGKLRKDKSCAEDCLINEFFINGKDTLIPILKSLFNLIFDAGFFPEAWSSGCIVPIYKKGDCNDPTNYRGITIISCLGKLFTSVLCNRLLEWDKTYNLITDAQFGFKPGYGTVDAIFVLQSIINRTLQNKGRLYCCFVDYKKAFDFVNRSSLWGKLMNIGIQGKMLGIIKSLYENVKSCVKHNGLLTEYFSAFSGLLQGEVMSPILYSMYVNDFEMHFIEENSPSLHLQLINLFILMYADDTVLMAETPTGLQQMLDSLSTYASKWDLTVNTEKTKIVIFRNGGKIKDNEKWTFNGDDLEIVNEITYLGMLFNYNGKFLKTQKHIAEQARKAYFAINNKLKDFNFNMETKCSVFDTYIGSILGYAAEIWGFHKGLDIEKLHVMFCKNILGVKKSTCNNLIYFELGRLPLIFLRKIKIFKYWMKVKNSSNCILKACYDEMIENNDSWITNIRSELEKIGMGNLFNSNIGKTEIKLIETRMKDIFVQSLRSDISRSPKVSFYQYIVDNFALQTYLCKPINPIYMKYISKFRLSSHLLKIESGRFVNELRSQRICDKCSLNDIEDEFHFILVCPAYRILRVKYIKQCYYLRPSVFKLIQLLSTNNVSELCKLGKFLFEAYKLRNNS